jgi:hypothetical protein
MAAFTYHKKATLFEVVSVKELPDYVTKENSIFCNNNVRTEDPSLMENPIWDTVLNKETCSYYQGIRKNILEANKNTPLQELLRLINISKQKVIDQCMGKFKKAKIKYVFILKRDKNELNKLNWWHGYELFTTQIKNKVERRLRTSKTPKKPPQKSPHQM